jgi:serine/threonine protein kinase
MAGGEAYAITTTSFALKVAIDQEPDLDAIRQEANLWKQAGGHPNVLIEADIYDGYVVIVSEYAPDGSLEEWVTGSAGPSAIDKSAKIVSGVLGGLQHLHMKGIIHRDLKPANILFQGETPRLADFGIARVLKTNSYSATVAGTLAYMAPEVFDGKRSVQTDIWAVGVILYRLVSGHLPYPQSDMMALLAALMSRDPTPLPENVPPPIQEVVTRALNRNPAQRYESAAEMREALSAASQFSIRPNRVETATATDRRTTVRTPIVVALRDDLDESTIVRPQSPERTVPPVDSNVENAFSRRMPIGISLDRVHAHSSERSTDTCRL